ncbi:hypothetical protein [Magnetospirillum sp. 15-1]|uniref:hypothetical protein n=1 Tax=Magnetospirillum sp. 15-1 TaxID=1979370 RepID=UPI000BBC1D37|nr:hypothetical protein [Magnetospirillum sp. 15-1]
MTRLIFTRPARKLAALLSLLMILLGGPTGGAFALCLGGDGHLAIEAIQTGGHDHGAMPGVAVDHSAISADCVDIPLVQAAPAISKKQVIAGFDIALPAAFPAWSEPPTAEAPRPALPAVEPALDPRLVSHRTVVLLN